MKLTKRDKNLLKAKLLLADCGFLKLLPTNVACNSGCYL